MGFIISMGVVYLRISFAVLFLVLCSSQTFGQEGTSGISGRLLDAGSGEQIAGASILIKETGQGTLTDSKGGFRIAIKPGRYTAEIRFLGYGSLTRKTTVTAGAFTSISTKMSAVNNVLTNVSVEATRQTKTERSLLEIRRKSANIQDGISLQQIERSASITSAQALQRVSGVTVRDGKYVTVRGLTDRNLVVQLNGARLSGANASRSAVPLDLIPAQLLDNIIVEKSVTPDKPGDATGAVVDIKTRSIPDSTFVSLTVQEGFNRNIGAGGFYNSFADAKLGAFGQRVQNLNLSASYIDLQNEFSARGRRGTDHSRYATRKVDQCEVF